MVEGLALSPVASSGAGARAEKVGVTLGEASLCVNVTGTLLWNGSLAFAFLSGTVAQAHLKATFGVLK